VSANLKMVRIRADLRASCEVYEFQMQLQRCPGGLPIRAVTI
jgi:hypothetical protein